MPKDDAYHLLQSGRRRAVLRYGFACEDEEFSLGHVARVLAAWEQDTDIEALSDQEYQRVYISLYQSHLPKLADYGVIDYNQSRGLFSLRPRAAILEPFVGDDLDADPLLRVPGQDDRTESTRADDSDDGFLSRLLGK